jgi:ribosome-associated protein
MAKTERKRTTGVPHVPTSTGRGVDDNDIDLETSNAPRAKRSTARKKPRKLTAEVSKAVRAALDKKALDVVVLDLRDTPAFTDFFILCSGNSQRQVKAIADAVEETLRAAKVRPAHVEGYDRAEWVLMDFFTFIVHVFTPQTRSFYALERLWGDAERIEVSDEPQKEKPARA